MRHSPYSEASACDLLLDEALVMVGTADDLVYRSVRHGFHRASALAFKQLFLARWSGGSWRTDAMSVRSTSATAASTSGARAASIRWMRATVG